MKKLLTLALLALMGASPLSAVSKVSQGDVALSTASQNGIIVFYYAADWDRYSKRRCEELMSDSTFTQAAGNAVLMPYPSYEAPTEVQKKKLAEQRGKLSIPNPRTYPALIMLDKQGNHLCTIEGRSITASSNAEVAQLVATKLKAAHQQAALMTKANAASGVDKAKLIGQACKVEGLNYPPNAVKMIKEADPDDSTGYATALETNDYKEADKVKKMEMDEGIKYVSAIIADKKYSTLARQGAVAGLIALWRSKGNMSQVKLMKSFCDKSIALNPDYYHAKSANNIKTLWLKEFSADSGWFKAMLPTDETPVEMTGTIPITQAGNYSISFHYKSGNDGLTIKSVTLYDGKTKVAEDVHDGFAGHNPIKNVYTLKLGRSVKSPRLVFTFKQGNNRNSYGQIAIKKL